jgi:hypothetical protein
MNYLAANHGKSTITKCKERVPKNNRKGKIQSHRLAECRENPPLLLQSRHPREEKATN